MNDNGESGKITDKKPKKEEIPSTLGKEQSPNELASAGFDDLPEEMRHIIERHVSMGMVSGSSHRQHPIFDKFNESHVDIKKCRF